MVKREICRKIAVLFKISKPRKLKDHLKFNRRDRQEAV